MGIPRTSCKETFRFNRIINGDARAVLRRMPRNSVDLSFWSPPYHVGKSYETDVSLDDWKCMLSDVVACHKMVIKPGGFLAVNIADILCHQDASMPRFQANSVAGKRVAVTRNDILVIKARHPNANRHEIARLMGCSEQTIQRRLENNNARGGRHATPTRIMLTGGLLEGWANDAGFYLYDRRIWHKDPCWANSRWHSNSYRADEFEHVYVFWNPGITEYDRDRLDDGEWSEWGSRGVWNIPSVRRNDRHEAEFPEMLAERVVRLFSPLGGVVIDPFVGSGTTACVARRLGRRWLGIDSDPDSVKTSIVRTDGA